jgi:hypothetical protein
VFTARILPLKSLDISKAASTIDFGLRRSLLTSISLSALLRTMMMMMMMMMIRSVFTTSSKWRQPPPVYRLTRSVANRRLEPHFWGMAGIAVSAAHNSRHIPLLQCGLAVSQCNPRSNCRDRLDFIRLPWSTFPPPS